MDDLISRQAAIDAIYETFCYAYCDNCEKEMNEDLCGDCHRKYQNWAASKDIISKTINSLPSAQPEVLACGNGELIEQLEQQWIPCSERLPEEDIKVLVTDEDGDIYIAYYDYNEWSDEPKIEWWTGEFRIYPIAWMPLPEPWKGEQP